MRILTLGWFARLAEFDRQLNGARAARFGVWWFLGPLFFFFTWMSFSQSIHIPREKLAVIGLVNFAIAFISYAVTRGLVVNRGGRYSTFTLFAWYALYIVPSEVYKSIALGIPTSWSPDAPVLWLSLPTSCVVVAVWTLIANLAVNWFSQTREKLGELRSVEAQLEHQRDRVAKQILMDQEQLRLEVTQELTPAIERLSERLNKKRTQSAETLSKLAEDIRSFCDREVRLLSHKIAHAGVDQPGTSKPVRLGVLASTLEVFRRGDVSLDTLFAVMCVIAVPYSLNQSGYQAVAVVAIGLLAGYALLRVLDGMRRRTFGNVGKASFWSGLVMYLSVTAIGLITLNSLLPIYPSLAAFVNVTNWLLPVMLIFVWLILGWVVGAGRLVENISVDLARFNRELEVSNQSLISQAVAVRQRVYRILHGSVQGRLASVSLALTAMVGRDSKAQLELMEQAIEQLRLAELELKHAFDNQHDERPTAEILVEITGAWRNLIDIQLQTEPDALAQLDRHAALRAEVVAAVQEGITNAHRHAAASTVKVELRHHARDNLSLVISNSAHEFMQGVESTRSDGSGLGSIAVSAAYLNFELQDGQAILTARWSIPTGD